MSEELLKDQLTTTKSRIRIDSFGEYYPSTCLIWEEQKIKSQIFCSKDKTEQWEAGDVDRYHRIQICFFLFENMYTFLWKNSHKFLWSLKYESVQSFKWKYTEKTQDVDTQKVHQQVWKQEKYNDPETPNLEMFNNKYFKKITFSQHKFTPKNIYSQKDWSLNFHCNWILFFREGWPN